MKWILNRNLRRGLLLLVVFCFSSWVYGLDLKGKTPEEIANLADITIGELADMLAEIDSLTSENQSLVTESNDWKTKYLQSVETRKQDSENYNQKLMEFEQEVKLMEIESQVREENFKKYESATVWDDIGLFALGAVFGSWLDSNIRDWTEYAQSIEAAKATE